MRCVLLRELLLSGAADIRNVRLGIVDEWNPQDSLDRLLQERALLAVPVQKCLVLPELFSVEEEELTYGLQARSERGSGFDSSCENGTPASSRMSSSRGCWLSSYRRVRRKRVSPL